ncbi:hypothetical protein [Halothiobacillus sp. DCM-1]|uniref:hypothetical protein n=1 Tax=Halothiobacillus sp. DCM-1 TaxID=3112558 RepID=UPI0032487A60
MRRLPVAVWLICLSFFPVLTTQAGARGESFVAPGLWRVVSDVHGPMGRHTQITQMECWNADGSSGQALLPLPGSRSGEVTHQVVNTGKQSIVRLSTQMSLLQGAMTQQVTLVFALDNSVLHRATMTGHGRMTDSVSPILNETFTQTGVWIASVCPQTLPSPTQQVLQLQNIPALNALQNLARQMQAKAP